MNVGNKGVEREKAIFELESIVFCAMCDADDGP
jgi:hypothetical protein